MTDRDLKPDNVPLTPTERLDRLERGFVALARILESPRCPGNEDLIATVRGVVAEIGRDLRRDAALDALRSEDPTRTPTEPPAAPPPRHCARCGFTAWCECVAPAEHAR